jgi:hypothetical protein
MNNAPFETSNLDLALTLCAAGREVRYIGAHQGVFRFESVKLSALRRLSEARTIEPQAEGADLLRFFSFH